jgi:FKBP-type peptidyl-prolyl cis-trans isomerase
MINKVIRVTLLLIVAGCIGVLLHQLNNHSHVMKDGLVVEDLREGNGEDVKKGQKVSINYLAVLKKENKQFDSSYERGVPYNIEIGVGHTIPGWDEGLIGMKVGGKRRLTVPSSLAYGEKGAGEVVPPNSDIIYTIELLSVESVK